MQTVITPDALVKSGYKKCKLSDLRNVDADEVCLFIYPSPDPIDQHNGDGKLLEIHDYAVDFSWVSTGRRQHPTTPDTEVWYR